MASSGGGGGPSSQPNPKDFLPPGQQQVSQNALGLLGPWSSQALTGLQSIGPSPPATVAWPFVTDSAFNAYNNQFGPQALSSSQQAGDLFSNYGLPAGIHGISGLDPFWQQTQDAASFLGNNNYNLGLVPQAGGYGNLLAGKFSSPLDSLLGAGNAPAFTSAQELGNEMGGAAQQLYSADVTNANAAAAAGDTARGLQWGLGDQFRSLAGSLDPAKAALSGYANSLDPAKAALSGYAGGLDPLKSALQQSAFDPQNALYDRTQQRILDQQNAVNAMSGVSGTPYGAGVTGDVLKNFNIDWQNNLLNRELQGARGIGALTGEQGALQQGIGALTGQQGALQQGIGGLTGQQGSLLGGAGGQYAGGLGSLLSGDTTAANLYGQGMGQLGTGQQGILSPTEARQKAMFQGASAGGLLGERGLQSLMQPAQLGLGTLSGLEGIAGGIGPAQLSLASQLGSGVAQFGGLPYQTDQSIFGNQLGAMSNLIDLGNQQYTVPQMAYSNLSNYMGLGQAAEGLASSIASKNFAQQQASAQGLGNLLGTGGNLLGLGGGGGGLFGGGSRGGGGLLSGLFGGGGGPVSGIPAGLDAATSAEAASPFSTAAGLDFGGGIDVASAAPLALSG